MKNLPTIAELTNDTELAQKSDQLTVLLNQNPPEKWVKKHPFISNYNYLPIDKIEYLLKKIFINYRVEVIEQKMLMNAVSVHVRVHYLHPITGEWNFHDGVGAKELQTQKDSGSLKMDMSNINRSAVEMALPIAKTIAIKDACDHFGRLFGSDLNRKDLIAYNVNEDLKKKLDVNDPLIENIKAGLKAKTVTIEKLLISYNITNEALEVLKNV